MKIKYWFLAGIGILAVFIILTNMTSLPKDIHAKQREILKSELNSAPDIATCDSITMQIINLGPELTGDMWINNSQNYIKYMISCLSSIAVTKNDQRICENDETNSNICTKWSELNLEQKFSAKGYGCEDYVKKQCIFSFADKSRPDTNVNLNCSSYVDYDKDTCYGLLATIKGNSSICLEMNNSYYTGNCMFYFVFRNQDAALCSNYRNNTESIDWCVNEYNIIRQMKDSKGCNHIKEFGGVSPGDYECYVAFAIYHRNPDLCKNDNMCRRYAS